jgi:hypothetical protein
MISFLETLAEKEGGFAFHRRRRKPNFRGDSRMACNAVDYVDYRCEDRKKSWRGWCH